MVFIISQQTFNEAVQENITDLGLSLEEATEEAIAQFKAQGVDLSQIVTEPGQGASLEKVAKIVEKLTELKSNYNSQELFDQLSALKQECEKGIQYKIEAGRAGAYNLLLDILLESDPKESLQTGVLVVLVSLITKQPDLLDDRGAQIIVSNLQKGSNMEVQKLTLKWLKECCVMHEMNRQKLVDMGTITHLSALLHDNTAVLKEVLSALRALMLDDDVRVEFGRAHEHARIIASETLIPITELMKRLKTDALLINDLMLTLSSLLVRTEFCMKVEEAGGIELIREILTNFDDDKVIRQCFKLIKALAGNDECKTHIIQKGLAPVICNSLNNQQGSVQTAAAGLGCVSALSLRSPDNSKVLFEATLPEVVIEIMRKYPEDKQIQRSASWAIRNMVSRSRYQNKHFLELGAEELLKRNLAKFKDFEYDTKAALRDLECNVELKEEWTGKGGKIFTETTVKPN